jgi:hypothetical protein
MLTRSRILKATLSVLLIASFAAVLAAPAAGAGADIWSVSSSGGFGRQSNAIDYCLASYNGMLYAGTVNTTTGCEVWRFDGTSWRMVVGVGGTGHSAPGFGDDRNTSVNSMIVWRGYLWVGTNNYRGSAVPASTGAEVWRFDGSNWEQANTGGFDDPLHNQCVSSLCVFNNNLYAGVMNSNDGCRVYRTTGTGALPLADWFQTNNDGFDLDFNNADCSVLTSFGGYILAGTFNTTTGCEVWRSDTGGFGSWFKANSDGFGSATNEGAKSFASLGSYLYVGVDNPWGGAPCKVYRASVGTGLPFSDWTQVSTNGFGDTNNTGVKSLFSDGTHLFAGTYNFTTGAEIWRTAASGTAPYPDWVQSNENGFGNVNNEGIYSIAPFGSYLFAGTQDTMQGANVMRGAWSGRTWYLAEGSTAWGYSTYLSIENPNGAAKAARVTYMTNSGAVAGGDFNLPPNSQTTINPRTTLGDKDFSTRVDSLDGSVLAVDRTMTWTGVGAPSQEAHNSIGVTSPAADWYLPEGSSNWGFECFLLIQNPNAAAASCDVTYMIEGGTARTVNHRVPANSRATFKMVDDIGNKDASIKVHSSVPVIPERSMYRYDRREGHDSIGTTSPASDFFLAEGTTAWGFTTYVLVQNPHPSTTNVSITYMTPSGPMVQPTFAMPANSRRTIRVNDIKPANGYPIDVSNTDLSTRVHGTQTIIAERAMYWGTGTAAGEACHDSIGMDSPHAAFYLPDGETTNGRETFTLVQNPNAVAVTVQVSYLCSGGTGNRTFNDTLAANSRRTYKMADQGINGRASVRVVSLTAGRRIMVERAMYWNSRGAGTDTVGGYAD